MKGVPSRIADNFFWLGRYAERLENRVQIVRAMFSRIVDEHDSRMLEQVHALTQLLAAIGLRPAQHPWSGAGGPWDKSLREIIYDPNVIGGVADLNQKVVGIVSSARERFSGDAWRVLNRLRDFPGKAPTRRSMDAIQTLIHDLISHLSALTGIEMENMTRGHIWKFLDIGRRIERSQNLCMLIRHGIQITKGSGLLLNPLLEISDSSMTYRMRYFSEPTPETVLEELLLDETNPRALKFNLNILENHTRSLPEPQGAENESELCKLIGEINNTVSPTLVGDINNWLISNTPETAGGLLGRLHDQLVGFSDALNHRYFSLLKTKISSQ